MFRVRVFQSYGIDVIDRFVVVLFADDLRRSRCLGASQFTFRSNDLDVGEIDRLLILKLLSLDFYALSFELLSDTLQCS